MIKKVILSFVGSVKKSLKFKRGQAAMEFLLTYGWAMLAVLALLGGLWYYGILSPGNLLPEKCIFDTSIQCQDVKISGGKSLIQVNNNFGKELQIKEIQFNSENGVVKCIFKTGTFCDNNGENLIVIPQTKSTSFCSFCTNDNNEITTKEFVGIKVKGQLKLTYFDPQTEFTHDIYGELIATVEDGKPSDEILDYLATGKVNY